MLTACNIRVNLAAKQSVVSNRLTTTRTTTTLETIAQPPQKTHQSAQLIYLIGKPKLKAIIVAFNHKQSTAQWVRSENIYLNFTYWFSKQICFPNLRIPEKLIGGTNLHQAKSKTRALLITLRKKVYRRKINKNKNTSFKLVICGFQKALDDGYGIGTLLPLIDVKKKKSRGGPNSL